MYVFFFLKGDILNLLLDGVKLGLKCPVFLWSETHGLGSVGRYPDDDSSWFLSHDENNTLAGILGNGGGLIPTIKFMMLSRVRTYLMFTRHFPHEGSQSAFLSICLQEWLFSVMQPFLQRATTPIRSQLCGTHQDKGDDNSHSGLNFKAT